MTVTTLRTLQPLLHDLDCTVRAPTVVLSATDGQIRSAGVHGVFHADRRVLSEAVLRVDGTEPESIGHAPAGVGRSHFVSLARQLGNPGPDPTVRVDRFREVSAGQMTERVRITSAASEPVRADLTIEFGCDLADIHVVKAGGTGVPRSPASHADGMSWAADGIRVVVGPVGGQPADRTESVLTWHVDVPAGGSVECAWQVRVTDEHAVVSAPAAPVEWSRPQVTAADRRLERLITRSLNDLESLRLVESRPAELGRRDGALIVGRPRRPGDAERIPAAEQTGEAFIGAGAPWYLTLFGRDSIWAARMMLPLGTEIAGSTLRALASRQGRRVDTRTGEAPGKIMHELRRSDTAPEAWRLPAAYYGTVDATPLWITLLHDAWRWGLPESQVASLLPSMEAALGWLDAYADPDGDGFVEYLDTHGTGLANQGWKDSGDAIRFADGTIAQAPIALVEVQGYAYAAARQAADLLDAFDRPGADRWRAYADAMATRFRDRFWVDGSNGAYPALALDADKRPVDALTSNIGHLLRTGILSPDEEALVARQLASPEMSDGYGLRTMSSANGGYQPLSYHCGSIWPHDTAIVAAGLAATGFDAEAAALIDGLLAAAEAFDYRLPEIYGGDPREAIARPVPYPAACHPQAWSAAAAITITQVALGLTPDVPAGRLGARPLAGNPLGALRVDGLRLAGQPFDVDIDATGRQWVSDLPDGIELIG